MDVLLISLMLISLMLIILMLAGFVTFSTYNYMSLLIDPKTVIWHKGAVTVRHRKLHKMEGIFGLLHYV